MRSLILFSSAWAAAIASPVLLDERALGNGNCVPVAAVVGALNLYPGASSFCSTWLQISTQSTTTTITTVAPTTVTTTITTGTNVVTADAVTVTDSTSTITADPSVATITTDAVTIELDTSTIIGDTSTVSETSMATTTVCATNVAGARKRNAMPDGNKGSKGRGPAKSVSTKAPYTGPSISKCSVPSYPLSTASSKPTISRSSVVPGKGPTHTLILPSPLISQGNAKVSSACSCLRITTPTVTSTVQSTITSTVVQTVDVADSLTITPTSTSTPLTTLFPTTTTIVTPTTIITPLATSTPVTTTTIISTTTVTVGAVVGTPSVVLPSPTPITGVDANGLATANLDDLPAYQVTLPFAMQLYGVSSNVVQVSVNGWIALTNDVSPSYVPSQLPVGTSTGAAGLPDTCFLPYWNDLYIYAGTPQGLYYQVDGEAPNRKVSFEWYTDLFGNQGHYNHFLATYKEAVPNSIVYNYIQVDNAMPSSSQRYQTVGAQSRTGGNFAQFSLNNSPEITPGMEITLNPSTNSFVQTNTVSCPAS
ncbi:hypothetical protein KCU77_g3821, partial [Aureobasidium melanogenum]